MVCFTSFFVHREWHVYYVYGALDKNISKLSVSYDAAVYSFNFPDVYHRPPDPSWQSRTCHPALLALSAIISWWSAWMGNKTVARALPVEYHQIDYLTHVSADRRHLPICLGSFATTEDDTYKSASRELFSCAIALFFFFFRLISLFLNDK